jgi:alpha-tubulin suppressor-like RCC1 family protein
LGTLVLAAALVAPTPATAAPETSSSDWVQVTTGDQHTCGIRTGQRLFCWGINTANETGTGSAEALVPLPTGVVGGDGGWTAVSAGSTHTCGIRSGRLYCWGDDTFGQLGDGEGSTGRSVPTQVAGGITDWLRVDVGANHTCALRRSGRLSCWGRDAAGQLGDNATLADRFTPRQVAGARTDWTSVSAGLFHTCAVRRPGRAFCWGDDEFGQLGDNAAEADHGTPVPVAGGASNWTAVSTGDTTTCGRRANARLWCWGDDDFGQLGNDPPSASRRMPVLVAGSGWASVVAGATAVCGRRTSGRLLCWGSDFSGVLGDDLPEAQHNTPVSVQGGATDWVSVAVGQHACARIRSGRLYCWGNNDNGQLGDLSGANQPVPVQVRP